MTKKMTKKELEEKYKELEENYNKVTEDFNNIDNKYKYLLADFDNFKKRTVKEISEMKDHNIEELVLDMLPIKDTIELYKANNNDNFPVELKNIDIYIEKILNKYNITTIYQDIRPANYMSDFDNCIFSTPTKEKALDNCIVNVYKKGYKHGDKIIRYEDVVIYKYEE